MVCEKQEIFNIREDVNRDKIFQWKVGGVEIKGLSQNSHHVSGMFGGLVGALHAAPRAPHAVPLRQRDSLN